ncbi:Uncharacterized protein FWK35_00037597 [Aphis craccivora]|uniref:Uncharacterized protein n=1 Tax=Aphis craccivora TaxID=307492 RepID=A0A6G0W338_APHCR|nr:Uncharacterized protein FWK35_00037597 [Aphis craccivora]
MSNTNNTVGMTTRARANETKNDDKQNEGNLNVMGIAQQNENAQSVVVLTEEDSQHNVFANGETLGEQNNSTKTSQNGSNVESVNAVDTNAMLNTLMLIPKFRGPYVVRKVLDRDRYIVGDIEGFQLTQRPYEGIVGPDRMKMWIRA